jgi:hypothetical protein
MAKLNKLLISAAFSVAALAIAGPSGATTLVAGSGWQYDEVDAKNAASIESPITFTVASGTSALFSLTDGFIAGDIYKVTINGLITATSTFSGYSTPFDNSTGPAAGYFTSDWLDNTFSHLQLSFAPGDYTLSITGNGVGGYPAGFGERLDVLGIPEPATWLTMLLGFGGMGLSMRGARRKKSLNATA